MGGDPQRGRLVIRRFFEDLSAPVDGELRREPIPDADAECEHCGNRSWTLIEKPAEAEQDFTRWRALACEACGISGGWGPGGRARPGRGEDRYRPAPVIDGLPERPTVTDLARLVAFPVFAATAAPVLRGHGSTEGRLTGVTVADDGIEITTAIEEDPWTPEERARRAVEMALLDRSALTEPELSAPARSLAFAESCRRAREQAQAAGVHEVAFELDGSPRPFALVQASGHWAAAARTGEASVTVTGEGDPPGRLSLRAVDTVKRDLPGRPDSDAATPG